MIIFLEMAIAAGINAETINNPNKFKRASPWYRGVCVSDQEMLSIGRSKLRLVLLPTHELKSRSVNGIT
jgi:hypothetical protein